MLCPFFPLLQLLTALPVARSLFVGPSYLWLPSPWQMATLCSQSKNYESNQEERFAKPSCFHIPQAIKKFIIRPNNSEKYPNRT